MKYYLLFCKIFFPLWLITAFVLTTLNNTAGYFKINFFKYYKGNPEALIILIIAILLTVIIYISQSQKETKLKNTPKRKGAIYNVILAVLTVLYLIFSADTFLKYAGDLEKTEIYKIIFYTLPGVFILPLFFMRYMKLR